jgi:DNA repair exonuclease SbcCD ATPase subunit
VDTAIVLSDDEAEHDADHDESDQNEGLPKKVLWDTKKRTLAKVESPAPGPSAKRRAPDRADPPPGMREELDQLKEELASERELLRNCRAEKAQLQQLMDMQLASLQLHIQQLNEEKEALECKFQGLQRQLQVALGNQPDDAPTSTGGHTGLGEDLASEVRHKNAIIASQRTEIAGLEELSDEHEKELAEAHQKITVLTQAVNELTVRAKPPHEKDETIQQLQAELVKEGLLRAQTDETLMDTVKKLGQVEADLEKSVEQFAKLKEKAAQDEANTKNPKPAMSAEMEIEAKGLFVENTRLRSMVTALEKEKQELTEAFGDKGNFLKQLQSYKDSVEALQTERSELLKALDTADHTIANLTHDLTCQTIHSKQEKSSILAQFEHELACREQQENDARAQLEQEIEAKDNEIKRLRERLVEAQTASSTQHPANHHSIEREELKNEIASQARMLAKIQDQAADCRTRMQTRSEAAIVKLRNQINKLISDLKNSDRTSENLRADLERRGAILAESEETISAKKAAINELQAIASTATDEKPNLKEDIEDHEMKLRELAVIILPDVANHALKSKPPIDAQNKTLTALQRELASIAYGRDYVPHEIFARRQHVRRLKTHLARSAAAIDRLSAKVNHNIAMDLASLYANPLDKPLSDLIAQQKKIAHQVATLEAQFNALRLKAAAAVTSMNKSLLVVPHRLARLAKENAAVEKGTETQAAEIKKLQAELEGLMAQAEKLVLAVSGKGGDDDKNEHDMEKDEGGDGGDNGTQDKVKGLFPAWMKG